MSTMPSENKRPRSSSPSDQGGGHSTAGPSRPLTTTNIQGGKQGKKQKKMRSRWIVPPEPYSAPDVLQRDIRDLLGAEYVDSIVENGNEEALWEGPEGLERGAELELRVGVFTVSGESLSLYEHAGKKWAILTPFAHPGDLVRVKVWKMDRLHSCAYRLETLEYNEAARGGEGDRRKFPDQGCQYFGVCGGCQLQPLPYAMQLEHKRRTLELAYQRFSALPGYLVPPSQPTIPSPKQWAYRTKITPHFEAMPKNARNRAEQEKGAASSVKPGTVNGTASSTAVDRDGMPGQSDEDAVEQVNGTLEAEQVKPPDEEEEQAVQLGASINGHKKAKTGKGQDKEDTRPPWSLKIGFEKKAGKGVLDIEECPIAAPVLNAQMTIERQRVQENILKYTKGAQILLRDSLPPPALPNKNAVPTPEMVPALPEDQHVAITSHHALIYERVNEYLFEFGSNSFFQNNNSILPSLVEYVKEAVFPASTMIKPTHLVDAYCGSGLFGITLSKSFEKVAGVEISEESITAAKRNAMINGVDNSTWLCGKAEDIFEGLPERGFKGKDSCVIVDPPRKGCDEAFLAQLLAFKPLTIVYVSCNVHTQARDVGWFLRAAEANKEKYVLESLRGFDLFPQTAHVEGVAVLRLQK